VVITFGPTGISNHNDHKAIHRAVTEAFHCYRQTATAAPRLYYVAILPEIAAQFDVQPHPWEMTPSVAIDITVEKPVKVQGLRAYRSQADAQQLAAIFLESDQFNWEWFYQAHPEIPPTKMPASGFWQA